jgi:hypothetical protein
MSNQSFGGLLVMSPCPVSRQQRHAGTSRRRAVQNAKHNVNLSPGSCSSVVVSLLRSLMVTGWSVV